MERSTDSPVARGSRQQRLAVDPGVSARSSTWPRRRCVLAASTFDGTSLEDDGVVERRWWQPTTVTPTFRTLHTLEGPCKYPKDGERRLSPAKDVFRRLLGRKTSFAGQNTISAGERR